MANMIERPAPRIACAVTRFPDGLVIASARHGDGIFTAVVARLAAAGCAPVGDGERGYFDQYRQFYTPEDARVVAAANGQSWFLQELPVPHIMCAASRFPDGLVIASVRHSDWMFSTLVERLAAAGDDPLADCLDESGFIDQHGTFYNREKARLIAAAQGQIWFAGNWGERELFSENLY